MSHFGINQVILGVALATIAGAGCSVSSRTAPETFGSQSEGLTAAEVAAVPDSGYPPLVPDSGLPPLVGAPPVVLVLPDAAAPAGLEDGSEVSTMRSIALAASSGAGVASPSRILAVAAADHQVAQFAVGGSIVNDHAPVYVIEIEGGPFTANQQSPGAAVPQGKFLILTLDAITHRMLDVGFMNSEPDLTRIGASVKDISAP
jgi:hypothetical protein